MFIGKDQFPFFWKNEVQKIDGSIDRKKPHENKVEAHTFSQTERDIKRFVEWVRKKFENGPVAPAQFVHIIGPVNEKAAPYHDRDDGKIYPVQPTNGQRMFFYDLFHLLQYTIYYTDFENEV